MAQVKDVARITSGGKRLPDVNQNELPVNAWLVWEAVRNKVVAERDPEKRSHQGDPGHIWRGTLSSIFTSLWPDMSNGYIGNANEATKVKTTLSNYLRDTNNLVCLDRGAISPGTKAAGTSRLPTWWIRGEWNEAPPQSRSHGLTPTYTERRLTPHEAGEDRAPAPVTVNRTVTVTQPAATPSPLSALAGPKANVDAVAAHQGNKFPCTEPGCELSFTSLGGRSNHENYHKTHRAIIAAGVNFMTVRGDKGANTFTTGEVAAAAGLKYGASIYSHFADKAELIAAVRAAMGNGTPVVAQPVRTTTVKTAPVKATTEPPASISLMHTTDAAALTAPLARVVSFIHAEGLMLTKSAVNHLIGESNRTYHETHPEGVIAKGLVEIKARKGVPGGGMVWVPGPNAPKIDTTTTTTTTTVSDAATTPSTDPLEAIKALMEDYERLREERAVTQTHVDTVVGAAQAEAETEKTRANQLEEQLAEVKGRLQKVTSFLTGGAA